MVQKDIQYGRFTNSEWKLLNGLGSAHTVIQRIKNEINLENYQLFAVGSILSDVDTEDIDMVITGPVYPNMINSILDGIVRIGFEEQTYIDVKFSITGDIFDPTQYNIKQSLKTIRFAYYAPQITVDGKTYKYAEEHGGLYLKDTNFPMRKTLMNGITYKTPQRIA